MLGGDPGAFLMTLTICVGYISTLGALSRRRVLEKHLSRKLMHIGNGLLFVGCWPVYSAEPHARYMCAAVPFLASIHFALVGLGWTHDEALITSATRTGERRELLRGPLQYGLAIAALTAWFWRDSPLGALAIAVLCAGDGMADIIGRRYGHTNKLFYSPQKSLAGTLACFGSGFLAGAACLWYLQCSAAGKVDLSASSIGWAALVAAASGAAVESLPIPEADNVTVPVTVVLTAWYLLPS